MNIGNVHSLSEELEIISTQPVLYKATNFNTGSIRQRCNTYIRLSTNVAHGGPTSTSYLVTSILLHKLRLTRVTCPNLGLCHLLLATDNNNRAYIKLLAQHTPSNGDLFKDTLLLLFKNILYWLFL